MFQGGAYDGYSGNPSMGDMAGDSVRMDAGIVRGWHNPGVIGGLDALCDCALDGGDSVRVVGDLASWPLAGGPVLGSVGRPSPTPAFGVDTRPDPFVVVPIEPRVAAPQPKEVSTMPSYGGFEGLICQPQYLWNCATAIRIAGCESGYGLDGRLDGNWAANGVSFGLLQLWGGHVGRWPEMFSLSPDGITPNWAVPEWNVARAYELWVEQGWWPWQCR